MTNEETAMPQEVIAILDPLGPDRLSRFATLVPERFTVRAAAGRSEAEQMAAVRGATYLVTGDLPVTGAMMRAGAQDRLKAVHKWGVGYDNIDVEAARAAGVRVLRTTGSNALPVAETAVALMLALMRNLVAGHQGMQAGEWGKWTLGPRTFTLSGKTVGLVGLGFIGKQTARLLAPFGCRLLYAKPTPLPAQEAAALGVEHAAVERLLEQSDVVSLHCSLTPQTKGLIDAGALTAMKPGAVLVNTARGGVADEAAVAAALRGGRLAGAAFDVFAIEPIRQDNPLLGAPNAILTPHIASQSVDNYAPTVRRMMNNLSALSDGAEPPALDVVA
jgi:phosphoglycerate dehydrogenase-like enzyme